MSQREHVVNPALSQASGSPHAPAAARSAGSHPERPIETSGDHFDGSREISSSSDANRQAQPRHLSVHTILNPAGVQVEAEPRGGTPDRYDGQELRRARDADETKWSISPPQPPGALSTRPYSQQTMHPMNDRSTSIGAVSDRNSPTSSHPGMTMDAPRRLLTPRSPRSLSTSQAASVRPLGPILSQPSAAGPAATSRPFHSDAPSTGRHEHVQRFSAHQTESLGSLSARPSPSGSFAAPIRPQSQPQIPPLNTAHGEQSRQITSHGNMGTPPVATHSPYGGPVFPPFGSSVGAEQGWSMNMASAGPSRSSRMSAGAPGDSQLSFEINPIGGERMVIPVETYSGSKQADEKRQRNAGASARFRLRKKNREAQNLETIERLEGENRDLERRIQEIQAESERLRSDRDRLRELVYRTPDISHLAYQGPQSPRMSSRTAMQIPGRSSRGLTPSPSATAAYGVADPLTGERASRRRRTEPASDPTIPPYAMNQPSLPAMTSPSYPGSHPGTPHGITRPPSLPPLSGLTPPPQSAAIHFDAGSASTATSNFPPTSHRREPYETGWAVAPSVSEPPSGHHTYKKPRQR